MFGPKRYSEVRTMRIRQESFEPRGASLGDAAVAIGFAGLLLARHETEVLGDLSTVFKTFRIVDAGDEDLGCSWPDAGMVCTRAMRGSVLPIASSFLTTPSR